LRRERAQAQEVHQVREQARVQARKRIRTVPTAEETRRAEELSRASLVRTVEQEQARRQALDRLAVTHPRTHRRQEPDRFGVAKAEAIASRWASR
jgi:hypothetical protein